MAQPHGGSIGQEPYVPTERDRAFVLEHVFYLGQAKTAKRLGISERTLVNHYRAEIDQAYEDAELDLGKTAMQRAKAGDGPMLRFLLATRFRERWSPRIAHQHTGTLQVEEVPIDLSKFFEGKTEEELERASDIIDEILAAAGVDFEGDGARGEAPDSGEDRPAAIGEDAPERGPDSGGV